MPPVDRVPAPEEGVGKRPFGVETLLVCLRSGGGDDSRGRCYVVAPRGENMGG